MSEMLLSTEQTRAVMHGIDNNLTWHELERPAGPQPIPSWCKGASVYWADGYSNSPSVKLKVIGNARSWPDKRFRQEGSRYLAEHEDGRLEQYAHDGKVELRDVQMFKRVDGSLHKDRRAGPEWGGEPGLRWSYPGEPLQGYEPGEWVQSPMLATTKQEGFGGDVIWVTMEDGREIALRGPWHVGAPAGFAEVSYVDTTDRLYRDNRRRWHQNGGVGGLYLRHDTFIRIMSRFLPHLRLASVTYGGATTLEPMKPEWDAPKCIIYEREWQARQAARSAS